MRTKDLTAACPDAGRRRFLLQAGWLALAAPAAASLVACSSGEEPSPTAAKPEPAEPAKPAAPAKPPAPAEPAKPAAPAGGAAPPAADALVTEVAAAAAMVQALAYVNQSAKPDQRCENCQLYTAGSGGKGKCQLFPQGLVASTGWCSSWAQKVAS